jgi:hypothetical protein
VHQVDAPINRVIYELCRQRFSATPFRPMQVSEVWAALQSAQRQQAKQKTILSVR